MGEGERNTCTGGWREMAAIFPTGSSREPIAFLERALRRQLWLKNCPCHVRHIFLAFPLFSSPRVPGLSRLSRTRLPIYRSVSLAPYSHRGIVVVVVVGRFASLIFFVPSSLHLPLPPLLLSLPPFFSSTFPRRPCLTFSFFFFLNFLFFSFAVTYISIEGYNSVHP